MCAERAWGEGAPAEVIHGAPRATDLMPRGDPSDFDGL